MRTHADRSRWHHVPGRASCGLLIALLGLAGCSAPSHDTTTPATPKPIVVPVFKPEKLAAIDSAITQAIAARKLPGGMLWLEKNGTSHARAFGVRSLMPVVAPTTEDTIYDAASLTKVIATTTVALQLVERGKLDLDAPVARYLPAFGAHGKSKVRVQHLLTHVSGLAPSLPALPAWTGYEAAIARACAQELRSAPGSTFVYSDINYIVLGEIVRIVSGQPLDELAQKEVFGPLQMRDTGFRPAADHRARIAPTELVAGEMIHGVVHDPTARRMGGVAGHAGLFTTASDLARFCRMLLGGGELEGIRILSSAMVQRMTQPQIDGSDRRGFGWDIDSRFSAPRGRWFPAGASFGHTGWTGTSVWIDPAAKAFVLFLSNRVHPDGLGDVTPLRREIGSLTAEAIGLDQGAVLNGIDVLARENFERLRGFKIGLITNQSGRDRQGRSTIDLLFEAPGVQLMALFSPEHGIRGAADENVRDTIDDKTRLPIYSLYGATPPRGQGVTSADYDLAVIRSRAPKLNHIRDLDALVIDLQDIGARFYTYSATLGAVLEAAGQAGKKVFVLDRINPITGSHVEGPVQTRAPSFIGFHPIPVRHGMTLGELALLFNAERGFKANVEVVRCENWTRDRWFDHTGLPWVNPSPSMRSLTAATLYPGLCLLEGTSLSMGRGTTHPFEQVGAPFIDGEKLAAELNQAGLPGVRFEAVRFTPTAGFYPGPPASLKHKDKECGGVRAVITARDECNAVDLGLQLALAVARLYPREFKVEDMGRLLGNDDTLNAIRTGQSLAAIKAQWAPELARFEERRAAYLLYGDRGTVH